MQKINLTKPLYKYLYKRLLKESKCNFLLHTIEEYKDVPNDVGRLIEACKSQRSLEVRWRCGVRSGNWNSWQCGDKYENPNNWQRAFTLKGTLDDRRKKDIFWRATVEPINMEKDKNQQLVTVLETYFPRPLANIICGYYFLPQQLLNDIREWGRYKSSQILYLHDRYVFSESEPVFEYNSEELKAKLRSLKKYNT